MRLWLKQTLLALSIILVTVSAALYFFTAVQTNRLLDQAMLDGQQKLSVFAEHLTTLERTENISYSSEETVRLSLLQYTFAVYARLLQSSDTAYSLVIDGEYLYNVTFAQPMEKLSLPEDALSASCTILCRGEPLLLLAKRCSVLNLPFTIYLTQNLSDTYAAIDQLTRSAQAALFACLALCGMLLPLIFRRSLAPLRSLTAAARRMSEGDYALRSKLHTADEVGELSAAFDQMAETVEQKIRVLEDTARRRELLLGALTHEMKTPMTAIIGYAESLLTMPLPANKRADAAQEIYDAARRTERLSQKMMQLIALAECPALHTAPVDTAMLLDAVARAASPGLHERKVALHTRCAAPDLLGDSDLLFTLLTNLIDNAAKASPPGAAVTLAADEIAGHVRLTVSDRGCGIPADKIALVTEPFYRVDKARSRSMGGAGLGLSLCQMIAEAHGAALLIESETGRGTRIRIDLPLAKKEESA